MSCRQELQQINKAAGVSPFGALTPSIIQGVFGFCAFRLLRAMSNLPVPGLETGGLLWITDLTQTDPYFLLPLIMGSTLHFVLRMGGESGAPINEAVKPFMLYIFPGIVFITTAWLPAALNIWLCTTGVMGLAQVRFFQRPAVRQYFGMSPLINDEQARRDAIAAGLAKESAPAKTIDVKAKSRAAGQRPVYQAPNLKFSAASAPSRPTASPSATATDAVVQAPQNPFDSAKNKGYGVLNDFGQKWDKFKDYLIEAGRAQFNKQNKPVSKTRSAEYMKQAEEYERKWKKLNNK